VPVSTGSFAIFQMPIFPGFYDWNTGYCANNDPYMDSFPSTARVIMLRYIPLVRMITLSGKRVHNSIVTLLS